MSLNRSSFALFGTAGFIAAVAAGIFLARAHDLETAILLWMAAVVVVSFFVFSFATKIVTGQEDYVLYRYLLFCMGSVLLALKLLDAPLLTYADVFAIGFGIFHFCGRLGCFHAGCCHGRPSKFGLVHREKGSAAASHLAGKKLFPVQLAEAAGIAGITLFAVIVYAGRPAAGEVWVQYFSCYALLRYGLEFLRGDADRPYFALFSEAQWTSVLLLMFFNVGGWFALWPSSPVSIIAGVLVALTTGIVYSVKKRHPEWQVSDPKHQEELRRLVEPGMRAGKHAAAPLVHTTSLGVRLSLTLLDQKEKQQWLCSISYAGKGNPEPVIRRVIRQIERSWFSGRKIEEKKGNSGVYHFIVS